MNDISSDRLFVSYTGGVESLLDPNTFVLLSQKPATKHVFTTFSTQLIHRIVTGQLKSMPALFHLDYHLERLLENAKSFSLLNPTLVEHQASFLRQAVIKHLRTLLPPLLEQPQYQRVRIVLRPEGAEIHCEPITVRWPRGTVIRAITVTHERANASVKSTNFAELVEAREKATACGAEEAILVSNDGRVTEGTWTNIFWFDKGGALYSPKSNVLPGITRRIIIENCSCILRDITRDELLNDAAEIFASQSTTGITPVVQIDRTVIGDGTAGPRTLDAQNKYWQIVEQCSEPLYDFA